MGALAECGACRPASAVRDGDCSAPRCGENRSGILVMNSLDEAWEWYRVAVEGMKRLNHLSAHWETIPAPVKMVGLIGCLRITSCGM